MQHDKMPGGRALRDGRGANEGLRLDRIPRVGRTELASQQLLEGDGAVVFFILAAKSSDPLYLSRLEQVPSRSRPCLRLSKVPSPQFLLPSWIVGQPATQCVTGRHVSDPAIENQGRPLQPPWPEPFDQMPQTIAGSRRVIDPATLTWYSIAQQRLDQANEWRANMSQGADGLLARFAPVNAPSGTRASRPTVIVWTRQSRSIAARFAY